MRIRGVEIGAFGPLRDLSSGPGALGDLVVVQGRNEAGKTSLFEFLFTLLYGIYPTSADRHPFAPWDGTELGGTGRLQVGDGGEVEITRRLLSSPVASLRRNGRAEALRNDDLPFVEHVSRKVFRQVYALGLSELAGLDEEGWEAVQDRILGRLGATDLRPAREVVSELEGEARALWRPDRRGQPTIRQLDEEIRAVSSRRPAARERAAERRRLARRLEETREVLESARAQRQRDRQRLERLRVLVPVRTELAAVDQLRSRAGQAERLADLPLDPVADLARRRERVAAARRDVETARETRAELEFEIEAFTAEDRTLLDREGEIEALSSRVAAAEPRRARLAGAEQERRAVQRRLDDEADRLPWTGPADPDALADLPLGPVLEALSRWSAAPSPPGPESDLGHDGPMPDSALPGVVVLALGLGLSLLAALGLAGVPLPGAPRAGLAVVLIGTGLVVSLAGAATLRSRTRASQARATAVRARREREERRSRAAAEARQAVEALLEPAGLGVGQDADVDLGPRIERCRQWVRDLRALDEELGAIRRELSDLDTAARSLAELAPERQSGEAAGLVAVLSERLRHARERAATADRARSQLERSAAAHDEAEARLAEVTADAERLAERLGAFDPDDPDRAAEIAARRLAQAREADERLARLRSTYPEFDAIVEEVRTAEEETRAWISEADPVAKLEEEVEARTREIERWVAEVREMQARLEAPASEETLDELEGELRRLREERDRARREYDRLWILGTLVDEADRRVRELHQPDILRLAGEHLAVLTGGRYDRLEVAEGRGRELRVSGPALPRPCEVGPPLSTGTREQIYVALRLALVRHLDEGGERLPLFLDEILVNWDPERRRRGLDLLERTATERQVFLFTCHPELAAEVEARGATRWRLAGP